MNHNAEIINTRFTKSVINSKVGTDLTWLFNKRPGPKMILSISQKS